MSRRCQPGHDAHADVDDERAADREPADEVVEPVGQEDQVAERAVLVVVGGGGSGASAGTARARRTRGTRRPTTGRRRGVAPARRPPRGACGRTRLRAASPPPGPPRAAGSDRGSARAAPGSPRRPAPGRSSPTRRPRSSRASTSLIAAPSHDPDGRRRAPSVTVVCSGPAASATPRPAATAAGTAAVAPSLAQRWNAGRWFSCGARCRSGTCRADRGGWCRQAPGRRALRCRSRLRPPLGTPRPETRTAARSRATGRGARRARNGRGSAPGRRVALLGLDDVGERTDVAEVGEHLHVGRWALYSSSSAADRSATSPALSCSSSEPAAMVAIIAGGASRNTGLPAAMRIRSSWRPGRVGGCGG